jgi:hypothetical protein
MQGEPDAFISLQPNSPEIRGSDLDDGLDELFYSIKGELMYEVFSVDRNLHQNAVYRMFRPHYLNHNSYSVHVGVIICERTDINTIEDFEKAERQFKKDNDTKWQESIIKRDAIGGETNFLYSKKNINWYPDKKQIKSDIKKYIMQEWLPEKPFINKNHSIIIFGDCYSQHIVKYLIDKGYNINCNDNAFFFYNSQFINTFTILEQLQWIAGMGSINNIVWSRGTSRRGDNKKIVLSEHERNLIFKNFKNTDIFIISMGLIEVWFDQNGKSLLDNGLKRSAGEKFQVTSFNDNKNNIKKICECLKSINPSCKIILQISPIPLNATFRKVPSFSANIVSKCILRGAIDEFLRENNNNDIYYYPSYELVFCIENPYIEDNRHLSSRALNTIMNLFGDHYLNE